MAWPAALTTNSDVLDELGEQGHTRMLESGNSYTNLHAAVAREIERWLKVNGVPDTDNISNTSDFVGAAAHLFMSRVIANRDSQLRDYYRLEYLRLMKNTPVVLSDGPEDGGPVARVALIKQGQSHYTPRRSSPVFKNYRKSP